MNSDDIGEPGSQIKAVRLPPMAALRCFDAAARLESFSRAADALHLTHGAISRAVRLVEDELGVALFERRSRRVFLTDAGRKLATAVRKGFGLVEAAVREIRQEVRVPALVVSCEPTLLMRWLIPRLPDFQGRHPDVPVHLVAGGGPVALGRGIDLAVRRNDFVQADAVHATPLFRERTGPVCRVDKLESFFERSETGSRPELSADAVLLHSRSRPDAWETWAGHADCHMFGRRSQSFEHFYISLQAAVAGIGVAIGPWQLVRDDIDSGILTAPMGFNEDGTAYQLLAPAPIVEGSPQAKLRDWLLEAAI
ncbi:LysR substrate-binding domain-containing protein (plasmid) [Ensifer adhaerens]|uniref:LysR substrate-binding domain-containing protein n=1 Tax=Ensifer adhaerens TaxID=106592 RepID=UPI0023A93475|nr:LysR substrate-binding domain-containing protein [Ensifer adhaerens]WDZ81009.1 LysR substrate-binding domain-containing protein [Ensifer adhaerens]